MTPKLNIIRLSDVEEQEIAWFWQPYIPYGKIILLDGDPECGKTYLALKIAAAVTTGVALPEYGLPVQKHKPANVLFMTGEDALADTIRPRFRKVGGNAQNFFVIQGLVQQEEGKDLHTAITLQHIPQLEQAMEQYKPSLLIVDPFSAFLGENVDLHRDNEMRPILERIGKLAEKHKCAVILIRHLNKTNAQAQYRGMGSIAISASARSIMLAAKDPRPDELLSLDASSIEESRSRCLLFHVKCNITAKGKSFAYSIGEDGLRFGTTVDMAPEERSTHRRLRRHGKQRQDSCRSFSPSQSPLLKSALQAVRLASLRQRWRGRAKCWTSPRPPVASVKDGSGH